MTVIDSLMAEYHMTIHTAMAFPLEAYLTLVPALVARHGGQAGGPDYVDLAAIAAREQAWKWLRTHFRILDPGQPGPAQALARWLSTRPPRD